MSSSMPGLVVDTILPGDCTKVLANIPERSVDLVFADPPYNLQLTRDLYRPNNSKVAGVSDSWDKFTSFQHYDDFSRDWLSQCRRVLKDEGTLWVIGTYHNIFRLGTILQDLDFWILNDVVWIKGNPMPNFRGVRFTNAHETLVWAQKNRGARYTFNYNAMKSLNDDLQMRSDWYLPICTGKERRKTNGGKAHATQKPEGLLYRILLATTNPGDLVLDPFFGTGTTGAVARRLRRHFIGIESNNEFIDMAEARIAAVEPAPIEVLSLQEPRSWSRIPFGRLLEIGLVHPGQLLTHVKDETIKAQVLSNGQVRWGDCRGTIHSVARLIDPDAPANGWEVWLVEENGRVFPINELRQRCLCARGDHADHS